MTFKLYVCGEPKRPREKRHVDLVLKNISDKYGKSLDECVVFVGAEIPWQLPDGTQKLRELDLVVIKDNRVVLLELKNIAGRILADCSDSPWLIDGKVPDFEKERANPFVQLCRERDALIAYLSGYILQSFKEKREEGFRTQEEKSAHRIRKRVSGWVVTNVPAIIQVVNLPPQHWSWFNAVPANQVGDQLIYEGEKESLFSDEQFAHLVGLLKARPSTLEEWLLRAPQPEVREARVSRLPDVDRQLRSGLDSEIINALQTIGSLHLYPYNADVSVLCRNPNPTIRGMALNILIKWRLPGLGSFLNDALQDDEPSIRSLALSLLGEQSQPGTFDAMCEIVRRGPSPEYDAALKAIEISSTGKECDFVSDLALERIWRSPFPSFARLQELEEKHLEYLEAAYRKHDAQAQELVNEGERLSREFESYLKSFDSLCDVIGRMRCNKVVPELIATLKSPERLGLTGVPWNVPTWEQNDPRFDYSGIFTRLANALGAIGDRRATKPLIECLRQSQEDWQVAALNALGALQDDDAVEDIKSFLSRGPFRETAFRALSVIGSDRAYKVVEEHYAKFVDDPDPEIQDEVYRMEYQLVRNNASRFEETVVALLRGNEHRQHSRRFLSALGSIATAKSVDSLFSFSADPDNYEQAGFILSKVMTPEAGEKALALLKSQNPIEVAFAITALWARSNDAYATLEQFEKNSDPHVRSAVADIYYLRKDRMRLRRFADDENREVKELVFFAFHDARKASLENQLVASTEECMRGHLLVTDEALVVSQGYQLTIAFPDEVLRAVISKEGNNSGIFVVIRRDGHEARFLVAPLKIGPYLANKPEDAYSSIIDLTKRTSPHIESEDERRMLSGMWSEILKKREAKAAAESAENRDDNPRESWEEGFL